MTNSQIVAFFTKLILNNLCPLWNVRVERQEGVGGWVGEHPHRRRERGDGIGVY